MREATAAIWVVAFGLFSLVVPARCLAEPGFGAPLPIGTDRAPADGRAASPAPVVRSLEPAAVPAPEPPKYRFDFEKNRFVPASEARRLPPSFYVPRNRARRERPQAEAKREERKAPAAPATEFPPLVFASPPQLVALPGSWIYAVPDHDGEVFFVEGIWWRRHEERWMRSHYHDHDWQPFGGTPYFAREIPENWKTLVLAGRWKNREWNFQRIPYGEVQRHWLAWKSERHWDWNPEVRTAGEEVAQRRLAMSQLPLFDGAAEAAGGPSRGPR